MYINKYKYTKSYLHMHYLHEGNPVINLPSRHGAGKFFACEGGIPFIFNGAVKIICYQAITLSKGLISYQKWG